MNDESLLRFHRRAVATRSVSGEEDALAADVAAILANAGAAPERLGTNVWAVVGPADAPLLCLCTHLDTVPPAPGWTRDPLVPEVVAGRIYGLGSNDAKASVAAMTAATLRLAPDLDALGLRLLLALTAEEETGGAGAEALVPHLAARGLRPAAVIVGEPTGLDVAVAQKGLLVLELVAHGDACHAAHGRATGARNAIHGLARDLVALAGLDLGPSHPALGPVTLEPTLLRGGTARNMVPAEASCLLDVRVNPEPAPQAVAVRIRGVCEGEVRVVSDRLAPCETDAGHPLVQAALGARPGARAFGSRGVSDWVFWAKVAPAIKVGPGRSERSHTADEYVEEAEVLAGARFYEEAVRRCAGRLGPAAP
ncbi:MAG: M20/M25/M40 family metallo-hydrolase [Deltaproteobacteria bacterium]|nr:M20/M25/M40 family metallo-hydrolase [Deltaproteobacteria bacterium]